MNEGLYRQQWEGIRVGRSFEELFGEVVGRGAQATVYARDDYAVKLYREGYPKCNVFSEAYIMANLEREHFPGPRVYEVLLVDGRYGIRMDRVKGEVLSGAVTDPARRKQAMEALVDLQCRLQRSVNAGTWAPDIKARFRNDLERNDRLSGELKRRLLADLDVLPDGRALCHCDFHADNVFFDGTTYTIIDLLQICKGDPAADAACSYVSYGFASRELAEYYLDRYCQVSGIPRGHVFRWIPPYAGTLLGQVPEAYTPIIEGHIRMNEAR